MSTVIRGAKVKVWNDYTKDHREDLQGESIVIPASSYIELPRAKAIRLVSQFWPVYKAGETNTPPKMLRIDPKREAIAALEESSFKNNCMACEQGFNTQRELDVHIEMNHEHLMVDEEGVKNVKKSSKSRQRTGS